MSSWRVYLAPERGGTIDPALTDDLQATADALIELALSRGGRDNISVVVAELSA